MTVRNWIARFQEEDVENPAHDLRRDNSGSSFALSEAELERVRQALVENPFQPVCRMPEALGLDISNQALRNNVKKRLHLKNRKAARKALITENDSAVRLAYADQHRFRSEAEWQRTVAVDEKVFATSKDGNEKSFIHLK